MRRFILQWFIISSVVVAVADAKAGDGVLLVDDFETPVQNPLGGYRNPFQAAPSTASARRVLEAARGDAGRGLRIVADRQSRGFCGYWIHLFDFKSSDPRFLDARPYAFLSFWVKGERGGERFTIKLADQTWITKEDGVAIGDVAAYLPSGVTREWQEVRIPIGVDPRLDWSQLGGVTFDFHLPGRQVVMIDDLCLKRTADAALPARRSVPNTHASPPEHPPRAMWIWNAESLLTDASERGSLWSFCREQRIDTLWIQLAYDTTDSPFAVRIRDEVRWRALLREAHQAKVQIHALDGLPEYALRESHHIPLGVVDAVVAFNKASAAAERFDGVHLDNEPHLLIGWHDPQQRETILHEFLELNLACQQLCDSRPELAFGVDIPFWWQYTNEVTGEPHGIVDFQGKRQAADQHCLDLLDNVGVMNYRDTADGADGMIAHGRDLLKYASERGRAKLYLGVETFAYEPTDVWFLPGLPHDEFLASIRGPTNQLARHSRVKQFRLRLFDDGERIHVGVELPDQSDATAKSAAHLLARLAPHCAAKEAADFATARPIVESLAKKIEADAEWRRPRARNVVSDDSDRQFAGLVAESVMLPKITFADESANEMVSQINEAEEYFGQFPGYAGIAIHYYDTFRAKVAP